MAAAEMLNGIGPGSGMEMHPHTHSHSFFPPLITNSQLPFPALHAHRIMSISEHSSFLFTHSPWGVLHACGLLFVFKFPACWPFYLFKERDYFIPDRRLLQGVKSRYRALRVEIGFQINTISARWNLAAASWPGQRAIDWAGRVWFGLNNQGP